MKRTHVRVTLLALIGCLSLAGASQWIGLSSLASAATCEQQLSSLYHCSYTFDSGATTTADHVITNPVPGDGFFDMLVAGTYLHHCTCGVKGTLPPPSGFGVSRNFFLCEQSGTTSSGTVSKTKMVGQTYNTNGAGSRTAFVCSTSKPPPPPPAVAGFCCSRSLHDAVGLLFTCSMTDQPNDPTCNLGETAKQACSGTGDCAESKPSIADCCQVGPVGTVNSCYASPSRRGCIQGSVKHENALCTLTGCAP